MFTTPNHVARSSARAADHNGSSMPTKQSRGQCSGWSVQQTEAANHLERVSRAVVFQTPEHRVLRGQITDVQMQSLQLVSTLAERQLLMPRERAALCGVVINNEAVIDPQQCLFAKSINALRLFAAFLGIMDKSPKLKCELKEVIKNASIRQSPLEKTNAQGMFGGSFGQMAGALGDLQVILARFDCFRERSQEGPVNHDVHTYILGMLKRCCAKYNLTFLEHHTFLPLSKPKADCSTADYRRHLTTGIDLLQQVLDYTNLHERIDKLDIKKALQLTPEFMALLHVIAYLRIPEVPSLDAVDGMSSQCLISIDHVFGRSYYQAKKFKLSCDWVQERKLKELRLADGGFTDDHLWVNYLNVCHIELEYLPFDHRIKALAPPWVNDKLAEQVARMICHQECFDDVSKMPVIYFPARMITNTVTSLRRDIMELYDQLLRVYQPDKTIGSADYAIAGRILKERLVKDARMDDIEWMMSLVVRGGLEYDSLNSREGNRKLGCPGCGFYGVLNDREDPCDFFDDVYFKYESSLRLRNHLVDSSATRNFQHIHRDLMRVLWFHKEKKPECTIARAIDVQKIWNERYRGSCLATAGDLWSDKVTAPANNTRRTDSTCPQ